MICVAKNVNAVKAPAAAAVNVRFVECMLINLW